MMNLKKNIFVVFFSLLLLVGVFSFYLHVRAQNVQAPTGLQVSPMRFDWDLNAGDERTGVVNLKNYDKVPRSIDLEVQDFYVTDNTTEARFFVPDQSHPLYAYDVINWIDAPKNIQLAPGEGKDVSFHVKVPVETPTGGYYGALFFKATFGDANSAENGTTATVVVNQRIGALLVMAIKGSGPISRSGQISNFKPVQKVFWSAPAQIVADMENTGNLHYKMLGAMDLYKFGMKVDSIPFDARLVYPGKVRKFEGDWDFSAWAYGFYTAKINLVSEDGGVVVSGQTSFWVIPWKTTASIIILVIIIWLIFKLFSVKFEIKRKSE